MAQTIAASFAIFAQKQDNPQGHQTRQHPARLQTEHQTL